MTQKPHSTPTRRHLLAWLALGTIAAPAAARADTVLFGLRDRDPSDRVSSYYGLNRFTQLSESEIYRVNWAVTRRRKMVRIEGYSVSESREIIRRAAQDWPATRAQLLQSR